MFFRAKLAQTYGWTHQEIMSMPYVRAVEYYEAVTVIEAQQCLVEMNVSDYPRMNGDSRRKFHREMKKKAYPQGLQQEMSFEDFARIMTDGR